MVLVAKRLLNSVLAISLALSGVPLQALATTNNSINTSDSELAAQEVQAEKQLNEQIESLKRSFIDPDNGRSSLDPFFMTRQRVIDERVDTVKRVELESLQQDYEYRKEDFAKQLQQLEDYQRQVEEVLAKLPADDVKSRAEYQKIQSDIKTRIGIVKIEIADVESYNPKNPDRLKVDTFTDTEISKRHYWGRKLQVAVSAGEERLGLIRQHSFTQSMSPRFSAENPVVQMPESEGVKRFTIQDPKGRVLHEFFVDAQAIFFFGNYLVFAERGTYDAATKTFPLHYIDLSYFKANVGNAPLAVFTLPMKFEQEPRDFRITKGQLNVDDVKLERVHFDTLSQIHQVMFNVNVALADPETYKVSKNLINEIYRVFEVSMNAQGEQMKGIVNADLNVKPLLEGFTKNISRQELVDGPGAAEAVKKALASGKIKAEEADAFDRVLGGIGQLNEANNGLYATRKFFTRVNLLLRHYMNPRPEGTPKLFNALVIAVAGQKDERAKILDFAKDSFSYKLAKYGSMAGGALLVASQLPEGYNFATVQAIDLGHAIWAHFQGYLEHMDYGRNLLRLQWDAAVTTAKGFVPTTWYDTYVADGRAVKFLHGLGYLAMVVISMTLPYHAVVNSWKFYRLNHEVNGRRVPNYSELTWSGALRKRYQNFVKNFILTARADQMRYWKVSAEAEKRVSGNKTSQSAELDSSSVQLLREYIDILKDNRQDLSNVEKDIKRGKFRSNKMMSNYYESMKGFVSAKKVAGELEEVEKKSSEALKASSITSFRQAIGQALFTYSSLNTSFKLNVQLWNPAFMARSFGLFPSRHLMAWVYPAFFHRAVTSFENKQHVPSHWNGGLQNWAQLLDRTGTRIVNSVKPSWVDNSTFFMSKQSLEALDKFENSVKHLEVAAIQVARGKAQDALLRNMDDPKRLLDFFDSTQNGRSATTGISTLSDDKLYRISKKDRDYYQAYFTRSYSTIMQYFMSELFKQEFNQNVHPETFAKEFVKERRRSGMPDLSFTGEQLVTLEGDLERRIDFEAIEKWAGEKSHSLSDTMEKANIRFRNKLLRKLEPTNMQVKRFTTARTKVQDPRAMTRAVRKMVSDFSVNLPMTVLLPFFLYSAATGELAPFDPNGFSSNTHTHYMSNLLFFAGLVPGIMLHLLADTWMKLQQDDKIDSTGGFSRMMQHRYSKMGFWRYYGVNFVKNPEAAWRRLHLHQLTLIYSNIYAAAFTLTAFQLSGLGRIDLGIILSGYLLIFVLPLSGLHLKMEQVFEVSGNWAASKIPRSLRAHRLSQDYINRALQVRRNAFSLLENFFQVIILENLTGDMVQLKDNEQMGTRAFMRLTFGGDTLTQVFDKGVDKLVYFLGGIPGFEAGLEGVRYIFTNNYPAFERYPERLLEMIPEGTKLLIENPNLPKNAFGEFLGKSLGLTVAYGILTSIPYTVDSLVTKRRRQKIQNEGRALQEQDIKNPVIVPGLCRQLFSI